MQVSGGGLYGGAEEILLKVRTNHLEIDPASFAPDALQAPVQSLREGGIVAFPTETVFAEELRYDPLNRFGEKSERFPMN